MPNRYRTLETVNLSLLKRQQSLKALNTAQNIDTRTVVRNRTVYNQSYSFAAEYERRRGLVIEYDGTGTYVLFVRHCECLF